MGGGRSGARRQARFDQHRDGEIAVVTNIGLEHTEILGKTRAAIAGEKVGILKPGAVLVTPLDAKTKPGACLQARAE